MNFYKYLEIHLQIMSRGVNQDFFIVKCCFNVNHK